MSTQPSDESSARGIRMLFSPAKSAGWLIEGRVRAIAGLLVCAGTALAVIDRRWLFLTGFVGINLFQSGISGWCLLSNLLAFGQSRKA